MGRAECVFNEHCKLTCNGEGGGGGGMGQCYCFSVNLMLSMQDICV